MLSSSGERCMTLQTISQHWFRVTAWCHQATSLHYLNQWWPRCMSAYSVTRPQWVYIYIICKHLTPLSKDVFKPVNCFNDLHKMFLKTFFWPHILCSVFFNFECTNYISKNRNLGWLDCTTLTYWALNKMVDILQMTFPNVISCAKLL